MPLKLFLEPTGPGRGLLSVQGLAQTLAPESVRLAIQRNDGRYLGPRGDWQPEPYWHPQFSVDMDARGLRIALGAALMDGIIAMQGAPLMLSLRLDGQEDRGVVRVRGSLIGSNAAAPESGRAPAAPAVDAEVTGANGQSGSGDGLGDRPGDGPGDGRDLGATSQPGSSSAHTGARWPLLLAVVSLLLLAAAVAVWYLDLPQRWLGSEEPETASTRLSGPVRLRARLRARLWNRLDRSGDNLFALAGIDTDGCALRCRLSVRRPVGASHVRRGRGALGSWRLRCRATLVRSGGGGRSGLGSAGRSVVRPPDLCRGRLYRRR